MNEIKSKPEGGGSFRIGGDEDGDAGELTVVEQPTAAPSQLRGVAITDPAHPDHPGNKSPVPPPLPAEQGNDSDDQ